MRDLEQMQDASSNSYGSSSQIDMDGTAKEMSVYFVVFFLLLALSIILSNALHNKQWLPEAAILILVGALGSCIIYLFQPNVLDDASDPEQDAQNAVDGLLYFAPNFFFTVLLPPIIFNSGYHVNGRLWVRYFDAILLYSLLGTAASICAIAGILYAIVQAGLVNFQPTTWELLAFASLITSTDPVSTLAVFREKKVDCHVFYLVFGESVLNDGVCIVLFDAFSHMVRAGGHEGDGNVFLELLVEFVIKFAGSYLLGFASGMISALILKYTNLRRHRMLELSFYLLVMYWPFFVAEAVGLSSIVTILFTGISARHYASKNLSAESDEHSKLVFKVISHVCEAIIFLQVGLSLFGLQFLNRGNFPWRFTAWTFLACLIGRGCSIFPMTALINLRLYLRRRLDCRAICGYANPEACDDEEGGIESYYAAMADAVAKTADQWVDWKTAAILWWSGLRGAIAYACAKTFPDTNGNREEFVEVTMAIVLISVFVFGCSSDLALRALKIPTGVDEQEFREATCKTTKYPFLRKLDQEYLCPFFIRDYRSSADKEHAVDDLEKHPEDKEKLIHEVLHSQLQHLYHESDIDMIVEDIAKNPAYRLRLRAAARTDSVEMLYDDGRTRFHGREGCSDCGLNDDDHHLHVQSHADYRAPHNNHGNTGEEGGDTRCSFVVA